jgi:hypothetical protein
MDNYQIIKPKNLLIGIDYSKFNFNLKTILKYRYCLAAQNNFTLYALNILSLSFILNNLKFT